MYMDMQQSEGFCDYYTEITESKWGQEGYKVDRLPITAGTDMVSDCPAPSVGNQLTRKGKCLVPYASATCSILLA